MRPDRIGLKDHADLALFGRGADAPAARINNLALDRDIAFVRLSESRDAAQKRRLALAARSIQIYRYSTAGVSSGIRILSMTSNSLSPPTNDACSISG